MSLPERIQIAGQLEHSQWMRADVGESRIERRSTAAPKLLPDKTESMCVACSSKCIE
jgi:hypothetical protein